MADSTTEIDLDSVIDRLLEGELAYRILVTVVGCDGIGIEWRDRDTATMLDVVELVSLGGRFITP